MQTLYQDLINKVYAAFNARDIDTVFAALHPDVRWANGWEGGFVLGHDQLRDYWTRQWKEIDPHVEPIGINQREDGKIEVEVHQKAKDLQGKVLFDGIVKHIYSVKDGIINNMEIEKP